MTIAIARFYDSFSQDYRWKLESVNPETGQDLDFAPEEIRYLKAHGFTILTPNTACNDTMVDYTTHRIMAHELNRDK